MPVGGTLLTEQNLERITNLIISYFRAVDYVGKNHKLSKEEKLTRLLEPLIKLNKLLAPLHFESTTSYRILSDNPAFGEPQPGVTIHPFISERVWKNELDLKIWTMTRASIR